MDTPHIVEERTCNELPMRLLIVGAGAVGSYFGGRLLQAGHDVTFVVRQQRAAELVRQGVSIRSRFGDVELPAVPHLLAQQLKEPFDVIILSCKAYDLPAAVSSFAPAVGPNTVILPLLNGMRHLELLDKHFGSERVLGGVCMIFVSRDRDGKVIHKNDVHSIVFGKRGGSGSSRIKALSAIFSDAHFNHRISETILQEMWQKWVFVGTVAGMTCLMRANIGEIIAAGATDLIMDLFDECSAIATRNGFPLRSDFLDQTRRTLASPRSPLRASMLNDIEACSRIEADHIIGDLLRQSNPSGGDRAPLLWIAYAHLKAYQERQAREQSSIHNQRQVQDPLWLIRKSKMSGRL
jgi:2-dehydropantoate 2-reductase